MVDFSWRCHLSSDKAIMKLKLVSVINHTLKYSLYARVNGWGTWLFFPQLWGMALLLGVILALCSALVSMFGRRWCLLHGILVRGLSQADTKKAPPRVIWSSDPKKTGWSVTFARIELRLLQRTLPPVGWILGLFLFHIFSGLCSDLTRFLRLLRWRKRWGDQEFPIAGWVLCLREDWGLLWLRLTWMMWLCLLGARARVLLNS